MESNVRGYAIRAATRFLLDHDDVRSGVPGDVLEKIALAEPSLQAGDWYPRSQLRAIYETIAKAAPSDAEAYARLERCGAATADAAIAGYMRLVLKILTPRLFAAKFPGFWARDHQNGKASVHFPEGDSYMLFEIAEVGDFSHIGPVAAGLVKATMTLVCGKPVEIKCEPWSLAKPAPAEVKIAARW